MLILHMITTHNPPYTSTDFADGTVTRTSSCSARSLEERDRNFSASEPDPSRGGGGKGLGTSYIRVVPRLEC